MHNLANIIKVGIENTAKLSAYQAQTTILIQANMFTLIDALISTNSKGFLKLETNCLTDCQSSRITAGS